MKTRILVIILLLLLLAIVFTQKDGRIVDILLSVINPVKQTYTNVTREVGDKSQSYVYQKENIQKLSKENKFLRKRLLEQKHYIQQVSDLYKRIPSLERIPRKSVEIVQTISYVKLNSFSQVILTKPQHLKESKDRLYGLIQGSVAAGVAKVHNNNLYGALVSNEKCRFSVFVGKKRAAGIAMGINAKQMHVKFIPKWSEIKRGDEVFTSGLDTIFFANIPVGIVERVEVESSYKVAYIKAYADVLHPDYFYLIKDPSVTLASRFDGKYVSDCNNSRYIADQNRTLADQNISLSDENGTIDSMLDPVISSIPSVLPEEPKNIIQTPDEEVNSEHLQPPPENQRRAVKKKKKKKKKKARPKVENLDMF
ncbi:MAG: rod shape-determining protein MreC [Campylobacterota bacterium]|nr:rod shape-determining protein MreC [Campylobacterota bacterium]